MLIPPIVQISQKKSHSMNCTKINLQAADDAGLCKGISVFFTIYKVLGCHSNLGSLKEKTANQMFSPCKQETMLFSTRWTLVILHTCGFYISRFIQRYTKCIWTKGGPMYCENVIPCNCFLNCTVTQLLT